MAITKYTQTVPPNKYPVDVTFQIDTTISTDVIIPPNQLPSANAGQDVEITLPTNQVLLNGVSSDSDGTIVEAHWELVSGPVDPLIVSPISGSTLVKNLVEGTYEFKFSATDDRGDSSSDNVVVIVKPAVIVPPPPPPPTDIPANYKKVLDNPFDKASDINTNQLGYGNFSTSIFAEGTGSFMSEVRAGQAQISSGWRSEQQYDSSLTPSNKGIIVKYKTYFDAIADVDGLSGQFHGGTTGTSGDMSLWTGGKKFAVQRNVIGTPGSSNIYQNTKANGQPLDTIITKHWYDIRWEVKFTSGNTGYARLYIDGQLYFDAFGKNADGTPKLGKTSDGSGQWLKVGQNLFYKPTNTSRVYTDSLQIYVEQ